MPVETGWPPPVALLVSSRAMIGYAVAAFEATVLLITVLVPLLFSVYPRAHDLPAFAGFLVLGVAGVLFAGSSLFDRWRQHSPNRAALWRPAPLSVVVLAVLVAGSYLAAALPALIPIVGLLGGPTHYQIAITLLLYAGLFLVIPQVSSSVALVDRFVTTVLFTSIPVALYGIVQYVGWDPLRSIYLTTATGNRVFSTLDNATFLAAYLAMVLPLALTRLIRAWLGMRRAPSQPAGANYLAIATVVGVVVA
ncbi:MAG: hypothetical protein HY329_11180, partial [Chloroflexi bacterium]|nr:hypothetical protein [Chloroflexota bacterium]